MTESGYETGFKNSIDKADFAPGNNADTAWP